jgi:hypothetical protein
VSPFNFTEEERSPIESCRFESTKETVLLVFVGV